jgi:hypothetical protein
MDGLTGLGSGNSSGNTVSAAGGGGNGLRGAERHTENRVLLAVHSTKSVVIFECGEATPKLA